MYSVIVLTLIAMSLLNVGSVVASLMTLDHRHCGWCLCIGSQRLGRCVLCTQHRVISDPPALLFEPLPHHNGQLGAYRKLSAKDRAIGAEPVVALDRTLCSGLAQIAVTGHVHAGIYS